MGKISAKGAVITLSGQALSDEVVNYEIEWAQDVIDVTGFNQGWQNYIGGIPVVGFTLDILWDAAANKTFATCKTLMGTPGTCSIVPEATGPSFSGTFMCDGIHPAGAASSGAITLGSVHFSASGTTVATFASA